MSPYGVAGCRPLAGTRNTNHALVGPNRRRLFTPIGIARFLLKPSSPQAKKRTPTPLPALGFVLISLDGLYGGEP